MYHKIIVVSLLFVLTSTLNAQKLKTPFEKGNGNQTTTYQDMVDFYGQLEKFPTIKTFNYGTDDNGEPIQLVVYNPDKDFSFPQKSKSVIFINNGIHPGEPDGIDASMMMLRDLAEGKIKSPKNVVIASISTYNISGMLNRNPYSRANQNGPEEYGFRGNERNYDLNRDFIKADSKNAQAFQQIFRVVQPDFVIDNHVSNGADYPYLFTYISTNKERLGGNLATLFHSEMQPTILKSLDQKNILHIPYVNIHGDIPDKGFPAFMDSPRYATGYTTLFNVPGTVVETHMLKPYDQRVKATLEYMLSSIDYVEKNSTKLKKAIQENLKLYQPGKEYAIQWKSDTIQSTPLLFKGYAAKFKPSEVSGQPRLYYDRNEPFEKKINFYDTYLPTVHITIPSYYVIPQSEWKTIEHLERNKIEMKRLQKDSLISVNGYKIENFSTVKAPYEGHYLHFDTQVSSFTENIKFRKGDYLVSTKQNGVKYLLETLEPMATDSFFNWNFYDAILGQKEYYSPYVFEDTAAQLLLENTQLKANFEKKKSEDAQFAKDGKAQLDWVYKNSPYFESTFRRYPIFRIQ